MVVKGDDDDGEDGGDERVPPTVEAHSTADELKGVRPPVDRVRLATALERSARMIFGSADTARLGRFQLLGESANGAMGVVWAAYDPGLERKVALKVLHPQRQWDDRAQDRLAKEAKSLARVDHPNVVDVHDVFTEGEQVVIVMEWVEGDTLASWQDGRPWPEVVAMYAQAGEGLAAAHRCGVVHRDFKPSNAIVGNNGRVRVLDFGLARNAELSEVPSAAESSSDALGAPRDPDATASLTATGAMVGTPAYAAPEQLTGQAATPASDQFSFAVALHRALESVVPFPGATGPEILASIRSGRIATGDRALPSWLRATVARALAEPAEARFPSMEAMVHELTRPRGWRRWRIPALVAASLAVAVTAVVARHDPLTACDGGVAAVNAVWNGLESSRVQVALQALGAAPGADDIRDRVRSGIDRYRDGWIDLHRSACVDHRRGEQSAELLDRRMNCLRRRLDDLHATIAMVERLDAASAGNALEIVARTPRIEACADIDALQAATAQPAASLHQAVDAARTAISQAMGADRAGRSGEAAVAAQDAVAAAERTGYPPVVAEANLALGRILMDRDDDPRALAALHRARNVALEHSLPAAAVEAAARVLYLEGLHAPDPSAIRHEAEIFLPISKSIAGDHFARPLLLNNLGTAYMAAELRVEATGYFQQAHAALPGVAERDLELVFIDKNLAMVTHDDREREALAESVWRRLDAALGAHHLKTLDALLSYAQYVAAPERAIVLLARACTGYDQNHPEMVFRRIECRRYHAFLAGERGEREVQQRLDDEIVALIAAMRPGAFAVDAALAVAEARLSRGDAQGAAAAFAPVASTEVAGLPWWRRFPVARAELGLGRAKRKLGLPVEAARHLAHSVALFEALLAQSELVEYRHGRDAAARELREVRQRLAGG